MLANERETRRRREANRFQHHAATTHVSVGAYAVKTSYCRFVRIMSAMPLCLWSRRPFPSYQIVKLFPRLQCFRRPNPYPRNCPDEQRHEYFQLKDAQVRFSNPVFSFAVKPIFFVCILIKVTGDDRSCRHGRKHRKYAKANYQSF